MLPMLARFSLQSPVILQLIHTWHGLEIFRLIISRYVLTALFHERAEHHFQDRVLSHSSLTMFMSLFIGFVGFCAHASVTCLLIFISMMVWANVPPFFLYFFTLIVLLFAITPIIYFTRISSLLNIYTIIQQLHTGLHFF